MFVWVYFSFACQVAKFPLYFTKQKNFAGNLSDKITTARKKTDMPGEEYHSSPEQKPLQ